MKIYIASSWKNQHAVELLTDRIREMGHEVVSFIEGASDSEEGWTIDPNWSFEKWVNSEDARRKFEFDIKGATASDLVIYVGPSGTDAWAEVGAAYGAAVPVLGLWAKGEPAGLMRHMMEGWYDDHRELLAFLERLEKFRRDGEEAS